MAHYETYDELLRGSSTVVKGKKLAKKQEEPIADDLIKQAENQEETEKATTDQVEPNLAKKNTWLQLTDDTIIEVKQGEQLPADDVVAKTVTKKEYQEYVEAVTNEKGDA